MRIDVFSHVLTPGYLRELDDRNIPHHPTKPASILSDPIERMGVMDEYAPGDSSVITMMGPDLESLAGSSKLAAKLARIGNDEMAGLTARYPEHFIGAAAMLPLADMGEALSECRRAIEQLGMRGIQLSGNIAGEKLSSERLFPIYEMMADYDLPIWIHPAFPPGPLPEPFDVAVMLHWPLDTSLAMFELARSEVFERWPDLKFITHHCGAFIPAFYPRIKAQYFDNPPYLTEPVDAKTGARCGNLRRFYADTAVYGRAERTLELGFDFFGADHILYGTDFPSMTPEELRYAAESVEAMGISGEDKGKICAGNARRLLKLAPGDLSR